MSFLSGKSRYVVDPNIATQPITSTPKLNSIPSQTQNPNIITSASTPVSSSLNSPNFQHRTYTSNSPSSSPSSSPKFQPQSLNSPSGTPKFQPSSLGSPSSTPTISNLSLYSTPTPNYQPSMFASGSMSGFSPSIESGPDMKVSPMNTSQSSSSSLNLNTAPAAFSSAAILQRYPTANCSPDFIRPTTFCCPNKQSILNKFPLPFGCILQPFASLSGNEKERKKIPVIFYFFLLIK
jgi:hypothetical protein